MDEHGDSLAVIPGHGVWHDVDAEVVFFNSLDANYHTLDASASEAWRPEAVGSDVCAFVDNAVRRGLLTVSHPQPS